MNSLETSPTTRLRYICDSESGLITNHSGKIALMNNGIEYYFVAVMASAGRYYGIHAYGSEAIELNEEVIKILKIQDLL
jgi:hypothetical protein